MSRPVGARGARGLGVGAKRCAGVESADARHVTGRQARHPGDVGARRQLPPVAAEKARDVAAVAEEIHDVGVLRRVFEAECVAKLMDACEIDDRVPEQGVRSRELPDVLAQCIRVRADEDRGATTAAYQDGSHLTVLSGARCHPIDSDERRLFGRTSPARSRLAAAAAQWSAPRPLPWPRRSA
jgi:hypothetical protein